MGLLSEVLSRLSGQRLVELTRTGPGAGGIAVTTLTGTVTVTKGSTSVVGSGTAFLSEVGANQVIQFAAQPGVSYVVASTPASNTALTLLQAFTGITTAGTSAELPSINYVTLQNAVYDAQAHFKEFTNLSFDDVTANSGAGTASLALNQCIFAGIALVVAYLYEYRGHPWPEAEVQAAWQTAERRLKLVLMRSGDGSWSAPITDSNLSPSTGPVGLPAFDNDRMRGITPQSPGPDISDGGGLTSEW